MSRRNATILAILVMGLAAPVPWCSPAWGQVSTNDVGVTTTEGLDAYAPKPMTEPPGFGAIFTRLLFGTVVSLVLCVATIWFGRRWLERGSSGMNPGQKQLVLIESLSLGRRCSVALLEVGDRQVLVGSDQGGVQSMLILPVAFEEVMTEQNAELEASQEVMPLRRGTGIRHDLRVTQSKTQ